MGITNVGPSDREKQNRRREIATTFLPKADELVEVGKKFTPLIRKMRSGRLKPSELSGVLEQLHKLIREASALCRGASAMTKEFAVPADLTFVSNIVRSLASAHPTLSRELIDRETGDLVTRLDKIVDNIGLMREATDSLSGPTQPSGQPLDEGELPTDELIDHDIDDAPDTLEQLDMDGITQFAEFDNQMPGPLNPELYKVLELPVMATFNRPTSIEELNSRGFDGVDLAGYIVLRKAYILGINTGQAKEKGFDVQAILDLSLKRISDKLNDQVLLVCPHGIRYYKGGWVYYWFGPAKYHAALGGLLDSRLAVTEFKFPFSGTLEN